MLFANLFGSVAGFQKAPLRKIAWNVLNIVKRNNMTHLERTQFSKDFFFKQLFDRESCTYTYLLGDTQTCEAVIIDPVIDLVERDIGVLKDLGLNLKYAMNTHMHADHITGTGILKKMVPNCQSIISAASHADADIKVKHLDVIDLGHHKIEVRATPGHTDGCVTFVCHDQGIAFTGDALMIRLCGRTDFQEGNPATLYDSVHSQIFTLPDHFRIYPAHDYKGVLDTTVWEEKQLNFRLTKSKEDFITLMNNLQLAYPKQIDKSLPANRVCGLYNLPSDMEDKFKSILQK